MSPEEPVVSLTVAGMLFMGLAWGGIACLTAWCFYRLLRPPSRR